MKSWAFAMMLMLGAGAAQADGIGGIFQTQANDQGHVGMVEFYDCGGKYCGRLVKSFDKAGKEISSAHTGKNIVAGMTDDGGGKFSGGTIWDPGADKTYKSKMVLNGKTLSVSGCVAVFCKTQTWTQVR
ncbi:DUF2147 domain-containing protein [Paracoccus laeviglucosivorans]|uniref:Uncharacterized conserved protein, DUF2147 family n=1 Tax=Paracoccus laeviglucosivorans TaxID=1197861 RepID=A0A521CT13_9RHOB|nr:DUF2147 domain-containing protein [Paracoccus laeviglucosivorans]SMO62535.1 Uncharacterized conserved protein, DUF2147 family [Paracoccus laeviglucosivorans]